ncbi:MAG: hypothetical protein V4603_08050 [Pseudomonadota bacterium]
MYAASLRFRFIVSSVLAAVLPLPSSLLLAQDASDWRGAWIADVNDTRHVLYLVLRDDTVSGFHCVDCYDPANLAFVDDGALAGAALHFNLYHSPAAAAAFVEQVDARLDGSELVLTLKKPESEAATLRMHRAPPQVVPPPIADSRPNQPDPGRARTLPAAAEIVTADKVLGLWLWGTGPTKQYFMFKRHKDGIRGMVCGPCDSAQDFAPLENISMNGTNFHFDIVHEDNGIGFEENGPFSNVTDAQLSMNELHMTTVASFNPQGRKFEMTLLGPVQYMPASKP